MFKGHYCESEMPLYNGRLTLNYVYSPFTGNFLPLQFLCKETSKLNLNLFSLLLKLYNSYPFEETQFFLSIIIINYNYKRIDWFQKWFFFLGFLKCWELWNPFTSVKKIYKNIIVKKLYFMKNITFHYQKVKSPTFDEFFWCICY